jgi:hypothetical protein
MAAMATLKGELDSPSEIQRRVAERVARALRKAEGAFFSGAPEPEDEPPATIQLLLLAAGVGLLVVVLLLATRQP